MASSPAQAEAERQARLLYRELNEYRSILPANSSLHRMGGVCRADGWNISYQLLDGDFALDELLAQELVSGAVNAGQAASNGADAGSGSWLLDYLQGSTTGAPGSPERLMSELNSAAMGPGNILGNANTLKQAANTMVQDRTAAALKAAAHSIESGAAKTVKINQYMTLYNANKTGKGRPRPRVRIVGMPLKVVQPALGQSMRAAASGASASMRAAEALRAQKLGKVAASAHWSGKGAFLNGKVGGGFLTFGVSGAIDAYNSIERDVGGDLRFDRHKFLVASARSQSGNLVGATTGAAVSGIVAVGAIVIFGTALATTPLILISLGVGLTAQVVWNSFGGADWAEGRAKQALEN